MKRFYIIFISCLVLLPVNIYAQGGKKEKVSKDIFGNTIIEDEDGNKTTIKKDIFGNTVIEDNKGNKKTIKKDIFGNTVIEDNKGNKKTIKEDIHGNTVIEDNKGNKTTIREDIFGDKVIEDNKGYRKTIKKDIFDNTIIEDNKGNRTKIGKDIFDNTVVETNGRKVKIGRDIFGYLQYEENNRRKAYLKKDIFDAWIFTDDNNNEIKYSQEFWADIQRDFGGDEEETFFWLMDMCRGLTDYKEEYKVDIFGHLQFSNNHNERASLSKNIFDEMVYEDSKGNKMIYPQNFWNKIRKHSSDKKVFMDLIQRYLFE
ncbi:MULTISPECIES: hypothetical protein [unclassified Dysgonomonas]|jgi:hypothetical protein|uniref:hypothetical protein n=1 Tax=Dysgonomonas sp. TaxID=1891233 RepID=UPI0025BD7487|nr:MULTISPECIES: hypothetical protein [unclassified Dysgonomonas]MDR2002870.1 hypothetical protein [Prevotella sp.]HMM04434.1 hypothetical protein [Dysgonomonas sp.]